MARTKLHESGFLAAALLAAAVLAGCASGSDDTLSGTAAVGDPIVGGQVSVRCASGTPLATTTAANGGWSVTINGQTLPCAVRVTGGTVGGNANATPYHSIAVSFGPVNVTPLTDLVVAHLANGSPATWFTDGLLTNISSATVTNSLNAIRTGLGLASALGTSNPLSTPFTAQQGNLLDDVLEAIRTVLSGMESNHAALLAAAGARDFGAFEGFAGAFATAYAALAPASGSGSGTGSGSGSGSGSSASCASGETLVSYFANPAYSGTNPYSNGQQLCATASTTTLVFDGMTMTAPVQNTAVQPPYYDYVFTGSNGYTYEVVFNGATMHEFNVLKGSDFLGQFNPVSSSGSGSGSGASGSLTVQVSVSGIASVPIEVEGVPAPTDQAQFCSEVQNDSNLTDITASGGTLTINSCSFAGNVGTINATLVLTSPVSMSIPYVVTYTYH